MILQHNRAHAVRARHHRRFESVEGALGVVRKGMDVNVNRADEESVRIVRSRSRDDARRRQRRKDELTHRAPAT
jgi:hypothetical protein